MASTTNSSRPLKRATPNTIKDKMMVGYQGWFTCAGDGKPLDPHHHGWLHWISEPLPSGGRPNTDLWPDLSAYDEDELYPVPGLHMQSGEPARLFSSRHPKTVRRHFHWMAEHGVDGVFLQRFAGQCDTERGNQNIRDQRDEIGRRVREAAEAEGRVFAIMYDVSGVPVDRIETVLQQDWMHLVHEQRVLDSPNYLTQDGKPVVALWGFGFSDREYTIHQVRGIISFFRTQTPGGIYIVAGVPAHWRTSTMDAISDPEFVHLWLNEVDVISPWSVGRYNDEAGADAFAEEKIKGDLEAIKKQNEENERNGSGKKLDYMPVVLPGGSGYNLSEHKWPFNDIKRNGGRFFWRQIWNARRLGVRIMYGAMWDEYDEGTAILPVVAHKRMLPKTDKWPFLSLDEEGHDLPTDWYMRIAGFAAEGLRSERMVHESFPVKELQDYWSTRPRFEETAEGAGSASGSGSGSQAFQAWESSQGGPATDEPAPPPYSLEAEQAAPSAVNPPPPQPTSQQHSVAVSGITDAFAAASLGRAGSFGASGPVAAASSAAPLEPRAQDVRPLLSTPHTSSGGRTSSSEYPSAYTPPSSRPQMENPGMYRPVSCDEPGSGSTGFVPSPGAYKDTSTPSHVSASSPTSPYASPPISSPHIPGVSVPHAYPIHQPSYPSPNGYPPQTNSFHNPPLSTPGVPFMPYGGNPAGQSYMPGPANTPYVTSGPYHHQVPTQPYAATHGPYGQPSPQQYMPPQAAPGLNPYYSADSQHHAPYASGPGNVYSAMGSPPLPPPPPPPRPHPQPQTTGSGSGSWSAQQYTGYSNNNAASGSSQGGIPGLNIGHALDTVERFTSRKTRQELERGVSDVVQNASKFMSKFTR